MRKSDLFIQKDNLIRLSDNDLRLLKGGHHDDDDHHGNNGCPPPWR